MSTASAGSSAASAITHTQGEPYLLLAPPSTARNRSTTECGGGGVPIFYLFHSGKKKL